MIEGYWFVINLFKKRETTLKVALKARKFGLDNLHVDYLCYFRKVVLFLLLPARRLDKTLLSFHNLPAKKNTKVLNNIDFYLYVSSDFLHQNRPAYSSIFVIVETPANQ